MTTKEIVIEYLKQNGFDGLCSDECGCSLDDLICCDEDFQGCEPAYASICDGKDSSCECETGETHYGPNKEIEDGV